MKSVVLIATSSEKARRRWRRGLQEKFAVHEVAHQPTLIRSMADVKPAVLLLDVSLPRLGGVASVRAIQRLSPQTAIVVLTSRPHEKGGILALKAGSRGYGNSNIAPSLLRKAVEKIQGGEIWAGRKIVSIVLDELTTVTARRQKRSRAKPGSGFDRLTRVQTTRGRPDGQLPSPPSQLGNG